VTTQNLQAIGDRIETLLGELNATRDTSARVVAEELLRSITELYGAGLERVVQIVSDDAPDVFPLLFDDELVGSLLLVHGLHPERVGERVERALASVRPLLAQHGGDVELLDVDARVGAVRIRLLGSCDGCPSSAATLRGAVEVAIAEVAPEITVIDVEEPAAEPVGTPVALGPKPTEEPPAPPLGYEDCPAEAALG
jgi:Fe-S cluster biogenesis protein NfuA